MGLLFRGCSNSDRPVQDSRKAMGNHGNPKPKTSHDSDPGQKQRPAALPVSATIGQQMQKQKSKKNKGPGPCRGWIACYHLLASSKAYEYMFLPVSLTPQPLANLGLDLTAGKRWGFCRLQAHCILASTHVSRLACRAPGVDPRLYCHSASCSGGSHTRLRAPKQSFRCPFTAAHHPPACRHI